MLVKVLDPAPAGSTLAYSPVPAPLLELGAQSLALGLDIGAIDYRRLILAAAFRDTGRPSDAARILLFVDDRRRPFLIEASRIRFVAALEGARAGGSGFDSTVVLRRAVQLLLDHNPAVALDRPTYDLLCGSPPRTLDTDVVALSSAIGAALARVNRAPQDGAHEGPRGSGRR